MKAYIKKLTPIVALAAIVTFPSTAFAGDKETHTVSVQTEIVSESIPVMTNIVYEAVLANAAAKTLEENSDWFRVTYRDVRTQTVTRNVSNSAESRYLDPEYGERIELDIPSTDVTVQIQKVNFEIGTGQKPADENSFLASELVLPES